MIMCVVIPVVLGYENGREQTNHGMSIKDTALIVLILD